MQIDSNLASDALIKGSRDERSVPGTAFLSLVGISKSFGSHKVIKNIDLVVNEGEYITLLGPSGCGKTTSLRMIAGFLNPDSGQILLNGVDIVELPPEQRPVNTVFQDYALFPHLTLEQNVEYGLRVRRINPVERKRRVNEMLALVQLEHMAGYYPRYLSGGQQQRVALARALILRPQLLLLDEPLGALDAKLREQMQIVLKDLQRVLGIAFIHVTHDQNEAMALSDRIVVMRDGEIMQTGYPGDLYHSPHNSFVADFLGSTNLIKGVCVAQQDQQVKIKIAHGLILTGQTGLNFAAGDPVFLSVRPQSINLTKSTSNQEHTNQFLLRITSLVYRGEQWLVLGQKDDFTLIALISEKYAADLDLHPGDEIYFTWNPEDGWMMKA